MKRASQARTIILASSSPYRKLLLERLPVTFEVFSPAVDETPLADEEPAQLVARLAAAKAAAGSARDAQAVVIGSDQVAVHGGRPVGKPGSPEDAVAQLAAFSGRQIEFLTAISLQCPAIGLDFHEIVSTRVQFRRLENEEIRRYVELDNPVDCAGSFKSESAGISLLNSISSDDPTAIVGLPLLAVAEGLRRAGFAVP